MTRVRFNLALDLSVAWCHLLALLLRAAPRSRLVAQLGDSAQRFSGALFSALLTTEEKSRLTVRIYDFYPTYRDVLDRLDDWEDGWFTRRLPPAPAHVLIGGCGTGREVTALARRGYRVDAFEPAPAFVAETRRRLVEWTESAPAAQPARVVQLSYEQLSALVLDGTTSAGNEPLRTARFDAVLLGCGSLSHVLQASERRRLLQALNVLCPAGPILASFSCGDRAGRDSAGAGRAQRLGNSIGRTLARLRGLSAADGDGLSYRAHYGFAYPFTEGGIEELARDATRSVVWERGTALQANYAALLAGDRLRAASGL